MRKALFLLLFLLPTVMAEEEFFDYEELTLNLRLQNTVDVVPSGGRFLVDEVIADLAWYPRESFRQRTLEIQTAPHAELEEIGYRYRWKKPSRTSLGLALDATIRTSNEPMPVRQHTQFPIQSMPSDIALYTQAGALTDINGPIREQALALGAEQDDLFAVVYSVADWVTSNIEYNLTTITADATQPSSWVMENRKGVCDELTALFISMLRSLGIPARFVSGISYTNLPEFPEPWGGHGWAEVWFPEEGWVPFDVTYGTYGYIDATHIKLQDSFDAKSNSVEFTMRARDASLLTRSLDVDVEVLDKRHVDRDLFTVDLKPFDPNVALESHNLITATVTNRMDHYVSARFQLARTEGLMLVGSDSRNLLLKPYETRKLHFLVRTDGLREGFYYDFPLKLYVGFREIAASSFEARRGSPSYESSFFETYQEVGVQEKKYNAEATLECGVSRDKAYLGDHIDVECVLLNEGDSFLATVEGCLDDCQKLDLAPHEQGTFGTTVECETPGTKAVLATATNTLINRQRLVRYDCIDEAAVAIDDLTAPETLSYDEQGGISFTLRRTSESLPEDVTVRVAHDNFEQTWNMEELVQPQRFTFTLLGRNLDLELNEVRVTVTYEDSLGKGYETEDILMIEPDDFSTGEKLMVHLLNVQRWIEGVLFK